LAGYRFLVPVWGVLIIKKGGWIRAVRESFIGVRTLSLPLGRRF